ncbi:unnamed protein product [Adineta steineri]|uniref:Ig-like domain-containing protein n=2 Tax=Adineta steineri TaxID=433720 RepID=A0A813ME28_9BILA|nr:unnamed protein product [Adineta steineri]CAF0719922.1 unnamed protein product [Adineta steineri]CAF0748136.1 unnamed protein product [Adineta steineri]CAF3669226.1 unnamed protein product [Adineta steineri]CAF3791413.1 unnamed protein product [Adineta steineri]
MVSVVIIILNLLLSSSVILSDDYLENLSVNTGETATFICDLPEKYSNKQADFYGPTGRLLITKTDEDIASGDRTRFILEHTYAWTWSLILSDVSDDDAGEYTCRVSSSSVDQTLTIIKRFNLTVLTPPKIIDITIESNNNEILRENEQIILKCSARGIPQPKIIWHIPGKKFLLNKRNDRNIIAFDNKLLIKNLSRTTPSDYQCIADNGIPPRDTRTKRLLSSISPEMTIQSSIKSSRILLNCTITARPLDSAKWKRNRFEINNIKRKQINDYTVELLLLLDFNTNIFGMYECEAENQLKVSKAFINIDDTILFNRTTTTSAMLPKYHRISSPSYAQIELLLNHGSICKCQFYFILLINIILINYSNGFYNKR